MVFVAVTLGFVQPKVTEVSVNDETVGAAKVVKVVGWTFPAVATLAETDRIKIATRISFNALPRTEDEWHMEKDTRPPLQTRAQTNYGTPKRR